MDNHDTSQRIALFIDAENLIIEAQKQGLPVNLRLLMDRVREDGVLSVARAYADWTQPHTMAYTHSFQDNVIELTQLATVFGKNTGDIQIVVDALEMALGAHSPERFIIIAGDRDYVPLIQRLRRYRKHVTGIGLRDSSSPQLLSICDSFLFYEDLLPKTGGAETPVAAPPPSPLPPPPVPSGIEGAKAAAPAPSSPAPPVEPAPHSAVIADTDELPDDLRRAFDLLLRAVAALDRNNQLALPTVVKPKMQQLDPTFDFTRFDFETFQHFADAALRHGYVLPGPEMMGQKSLRPGRRPSLPVPAELQFAGRFESDADALRFYREALANKRVPLIQWDQRRRLLERLWDRLEEDHAAGGPGLTLFEMTEVVADGAGRSFFNLPRVALEKLAYTTLIARAVYLANPNEPELRQRRYHADCDFEEALIRVNLAYVRGIKLEYPDVVLMRRPLALLLFGTDGGDSLHDVETVLERLGRG